MKAYFQRGESPFVGITEYPSPLVGYGALCVEDINADISKSSSQEVYSWLAENSHEYGFIQRYPDDKTEITGISYEPWHYRYVGEDVASEIYEEEICLEEYIEKINM